jgi:hypothetical protein
LAERLWWDKCAVLGKIKDCARLIQETEGEIFPAGSLKDLYSKEENAAESKLAKRVRIPKPDEV